MYYVTLSYVCNAFKLSVYHIYLPVNMLSKCHFYLYLTTV